MHDRLQEIRARLDLAGTFSVDGPDNSHFIAHAPADIAWLLGEVERLRRDDSVVQGVTKLERSGE